LSGDEGPAVPELPLKLGPPPKPRLQLSANIRHEVQRDLTPSVRLSRGARVVSSLGLLFLASAAFVALEVGDGVHSVSRGAAFGAIGWALVVASVLLAGVGRFGAYMRWLQMGIALFVPLALLSYLALEATSWVPLSTFFRDGDHTHKALACCSTAVALGAVGTAVVLFVWKRTDPFNPGWSGAVLGLLGGLGGAASVELVCPWHEGWHLWLGHGLGVLVLSFLGALVGRRLMAP
jgi:hypothetical protein